MGGREGGEPDPAQHAPPGIPPLGAPGLEPV